MIKIKEFNDYDFKITWKLLYLGYRGNDVFANQLSVSDILNYAIEQLENEACDELVCELASEYERNTENIANLLKELAEKEDSNENLESRKWRALIVAKELATKNDNFINGLLSLGDLWIQLGFPKDSPHVFQGKDNNIAPEEYYTEENYCKIYEEHIAWLNNEIQFIKYNQN